MASGGSTLAVLTLTACANGLLRMRCAGHGGSGDHFRGLRCMPRPAAYARKSDRASALGTSIPQQVKGQGFVTSSRATRTTWRSNVEQVWPPCRPLHFTNPSPIIPKHPPHTAHVRMAPSTPADSRGSCAPRDSLEAHSMAAGGRAARAKDLFNLRGAGGQVVGRCGGRAGVLCSRL